MYEDLGLRPSISSKRTHVLKRRQPSPVFRDSKEENGRATLSQEFIFLNLCIFPSQCGWLTYPFLFSFLGYSARLVCIQPKLSILPVVHTPSRNGANFSSPSRPVFSPVGFLSLLLNVFHLCEVQVYFDPRHSHIHQESHLLLTDFLLQVFHVQVYLLFMFGYMHGSCLDSMHLLFFLAAPNCFNYCCFLICFDHLKGIIYSITLPYPSLRFPRYYIFISQ